jgi:3-oxoadipate enol-lactonase
VSYVEVLGDRFHYVEAGSGEPVLLLHPAPLDHSVWFNQMLALSNDYRVIALDQRCFGLSVKTTTPFDISVFGEDIDRFLAALRIDRAHVIGISMGGIAAQFLALAHPARLGKMILVSTTSSLAGVDIAAKRLKGFAEKGLASYYTHSVRSLLSEAYGASPQGEYFISLLTKRVKHLDLQSLTTFYKALAALDISAAVRTIDVPTLVIAGAEDFTFDLSRRTADAIAGSQFVTAKGCGRLVPVERPKEFNELVLSFLSD